MAKTLPDLSHEIRFLSMVRKIYSNSVGDDDLGVLNEGKLLLAAFPPVPDITGEHLGVVMVT